MDIKACFDRIHLRDILVETAKAGIVGKPLRMIAEYTNNLKIRLQGDCDPDREVKIQNSTGQGSGFAPVGTSMTMAATLEEKIEMRSDEERKKIISEVKGVPLEPEFFVDDLHKICANEDELALNGEVIDETLAELKLDAHPEKSGILVFGRKREALKEKILKKPTTIQGFNLQFKESETYLGMVFSELGANDSISQTLEKRKYKCYTKAGELARKAEDDRLLSLGWLAVIKQLYNGIVVPTLTYGCSAFTGMTKQHLKTLESIQRTCLISMLGISYKTNYRALLYVLGIMPVVDVVKKLQIGFVNDLFHLKGSGICLNTLKKDEEAGGIVGLLEEVREYCRQYGIQDVTQEYVHPNEIKRKIVHSVMDTLWREVNENPAIPWTTRRTNLENPKYDQDAKVSAKLSLCCASGSLNFKRSRRHEYMRKHGNLDCLTPGCCQVDSLEHVQICYGYAERPKANGNHEDWSDFLMRLEQERVWKFGARYSLVNFKKVV